MSRYRMVHCAIWSDDKFPFLSDDAQLVWFHLYTNEFTTSCGIYKAPLEGLAADKRWTLKRYREGFRECLQQGLVEYDERLYVIAFPRFFAWNRPANPNVLQNWLSAWEAVPRSPLKRTHYQRLAEACKRWGEGFEKVLERFAETLPPTFEEPSPKQEQEQEKEQEQDITPPVSPPSADSGKKGRTSRRPSKRCPPDFEVTDDMIAWATENFPGVNIEHETAAFRDYEFRNAKTDWPATWRNWIRKAAERNGNAQSRPSVAASFEGKEYDGTPEEELPAWGRGG